MADLDPYELTAGQLRDLFDRLVVPYVFGASQPSNQPIAILTGAQPAAGKSRAMAAVREQNADRDVIQLSGDDMRQFHPAFAELMDTDPIAMVPATQQAANAWMQMAFTHAIEHGYSFVSEGTFRNPEAVLADAKFFATGQRGEELAAPLPEGRDRHQVWILALAVRAERSRLDAMHRYLAPGAEAGRWVWPEWANASYNAIPVTVAAAEESPDVHRVIVTNRSGADLYTNTRQADGTMQRPPAAAEAVLTERARPLPTADADGWLTRQQDVVLRFVATGQVNATTYEGLRIALTDAWAIIPMSSAAAGQSLLDAQEVQSSLDRLLHWAHEGPHLQRPVLLIPDAVIHARLAQPNSQRTLGLTAELRGELGRRTALSPAVRTVEDAIRTSAQTLAELRRGATRIPGPAGPGLSAAAARSRSTTTAPTGKRQSTATTGEQAAHLRRAAQDGQQRRHGPTQR
ncbi:zeta toxin family protein [Kitasatospora sp. NPDC101155]|uniref:zeta toxin family protein n=1 Tax=Kitasatospora sp. NPDC101155 TaxID=3364097 RepID=UPI00382B15A4